MISLVLLGCDGVTPNNPYPRSQAEQNILYGSFTERPKYLDPARSYSSDESIFTAQIYEPPLQYRYAPKVYELIPQTATELPLVKYFDQKGQVIDADKFPEQVSKTLYQIRIKPGIHYQPHPSFAKDQNNNFVYHDLNPGELKQITDLDDFTQTGTRELIAEDYVYEIKRIAWPRLDSPIYELMSSHIVGFKEFHDSLRVKDPGPQGIKEGNISGVRSLDNYTYEIEIQGLYRQFPYWLAMPFFCPIPWEADAFYNQPGLIEKNIVLDWYPVGTGPYMMEKNDPNFKIILTRNLNYSVMPQIEKVIYSLEKESIPMWNKFLQGYFDASGVDSDNFATAIQMVAGQSEITPKLEAKGISLVKEVEMADYYFGFNMHDEVIGGYTEDKIKLRQAIAIALNFDEYIDIFLNGRGVPAQFIIPPGVFGYDETPNPYVHGKTLDEAKLLLKEAGYPEGRDAKTNEPLILHFDTTSSGSPQEMSRDAWMRKQFKKLGLDLDVRTTDYNRFREKLDAGTAQMFMFGWVGDYPDPENFLFLLYGPNKQEGTDGVNSTNYQNPDYDRLYQKMILLPNNEERKAVIDQMRDLAQKEAPMAWGFVPESYLLKQAWLQNVVTNAMVRNGLKYYVIDGEARAKAREAWNKPRLWLLPLTLSLFALILIPVWIGYRRKLYHNQAKRFKD